MQSRKNKGGNGAGADRLMAAIKNVPNKKEPKTVKATTVPKKPKEEKPKEQKLKRPNIRSYKGDREGYENYEQHTMPKNLRTKLR